MSRQRQSIQMVTKRCTEKREDLQQKEKTQKNTKQTVSEMVELFSPFLERRKQKNLINKIKHYNGDKQTYAQIIKERQEMQQHMKKDTMRKPYITIGTLTSECLRQMRKR